MSVASQSASFNSSTASMYLDTSEDMETLKVKNDVKAILKSRIFLGRYLERRLVDQRIGYRDVVVVSPAEVDLKRDLLEAQHKLRNACPKIHWIGITESDVIGHPSGVCLWTNIDNQLLGPCWFQIKSLKFRMDEVVVILKCLRHISDAFLEIEPLLTGVGVAKKIKESSDSKDDTSVTSFNETYYEVVENLRSAVSIKTVKEFVTFLIAFVIAIFTGGISFVNFLGNFVLALIREISIFIKHSTPMFLGLLDFFSKIIGGFYILLAMLFKQNVPAPHSKRSLAFHDQHKNQYNDGQFD